MVVKDVKEIERRATATKMPEGASRETMLLIGALRQDMRILLRELERVESIKNLYANRVETLNDMLKKEREAKAYVG